MSNAEAGRTPRSVAVRRPEHGQGDTKLTTWLARGFGRVEDVVYVGLAVILAALAVGLLVDGAITFVQAIMANELASRVALLLDRLLLVLMVVEILYTVQVSLREHTLSPEPFLVVGLIAGIRRILVLTAEFSKMLEEGSDTFRNAMLELAVLTVMVLALVGALVLLRRRATPAVAERS
jgi:uncharacterized membrane protein (DUF373 family)